MRLEGTTAIRFAQANDLPLCKYTDPTEGARTDLTIDEANAVAREDARLIYIDTALLVVDPITDATETAAECTIAPLDGNAIAIDDQRLIRRLYDAPGTKSYGESSYTVA